MLPEQYKELLYPPHTDSLAVNILLLLNLLVFSKSLSSSVTSSASLNLLKANC